MVTAHGGTGTGTGRNRDHSTVAVLATFLIDNEAVSDHIEIGYDHDQSPCGPYTGCQWPQHMIRQVLEDLDLHADG